MEAENIPSSQPVGDNIPGTPVEISSPKRGVWPFWPTIGFGFAIFSIYFIAQAIVAVIFAVIFTLQQYTSNPNLDPVQLINALTSNGLLLSIATVISAIAGGAAIVLFIKLRKEISVSEYLGLKSVSKINILILIGISVLLIAASSGLDRFFPQSQNANFTVEAYNTALWPVLLGLAVVIFAPLFEESFFRGFLFVGFLRSRLGAAGTIMLTSAAWAALHLQYDIYGIVSIFILGIVLGVVRLKTGSLWAAITLHGLWNLAAIAGTALSVNGIGS